MTRPILTAAILVLPPFFGCGEPPGTVFTPPKVDSPADRRSHEKGPGEVINHRNIPMH